MVELTNTEETIMKCLWKLGNDVTVADLLESLQETYGKIYARTTISVFMSYLRDKGYVTYEKKSHAFVYHPLISEQSYQNELLKRYMERYFDNSMPKFMQAVLENQKPGKNDCELMHQMLEDYRKQL